MLLIFRGAKFQPVDVGEVADRIVDLAGKEPVGRAPDFGGPEVLTMEEMAASWKRAAKIRKPILAVPSLLGFPRQWAAGDLLSPEHREGKKTWKDWLQTRYGLS